MGCARMVAVVAVACTEEARVVLDDGRVYMHTDENDVDHFRTGQPIRCRDWRNGTELCDACEAAFKRQYPQGWKYYPGDVCRHRKYVGGSGIDWICQACEDE